MTISRDCSKRASTIGAESLPSPRITSIPKLPGRKSRGSNSKRSPAILLCASVLRSILNLSAGTNFFRRPCAIASPDWRTRTDTRVAPGLRPLAELFSMSPGKKLKITALAGGVGASKLLLGLYQVMDPRLLTIIVNTGDDIVLHGLKISPDLDIITYTLAGIVDSAKGWGFRGETFHALKRLGVFGRETWFNLGDRDLATHIHRTSLLGEGKTLAEAADSIRIALGVKARILPMSNQPVPTIIETDEGPLHFQEYLVKRRSQPVVRGIRFVGVDLAEPAPGVLEAIREAGRILICPSNPLISIGPILAVPGIREALRARKRDVLAVCPIVGGKSLKGPSDRMLAQLGHEVSARGVARLYADFAGIFVIDPADKAQVASVRSLGMEVVVMPTVMKTLPQKRTLARALLTLMP